MAYDIHSLRNPWTKFSGGWNTQDQPQYITDDQSPDLLNVHPFGAGGYAPRFGISLIGNALMSVGSIPSLFNFRTVTSEILIRSINKRLEYLKVSTNTWTTLPATHATSALAASANPLAGDVVVVGAFTYTFVAALAAPFDVLIGATRDASLDNLTRAIVLDPSGSGVVYDAGTTLNTDAIAEHSAGSMEMLIITVLTNVAANAIVTTTTSAGLLWSSATALGGTDNLSWTDSLKWEFDTIVIKNTSKSVMFGGNGTDNVFSWDGATDARGYAHIQKGKLYAFFVSRLCISGVASNPARVYFSRTDVPSDYTLVPVNSVADDPTLADMGDGGDVITGLKLGTSPESTAQKVLYIIKKGSATWYARFDVNTGFLSYDILIQDTGGINQRSTVVVDNQVFIVDPGNNIASLGRNENIQNEIRTNPESLSIDKTLPFLNFDDSCSIFWKKRRILLFSAKKFGASTNNIQLAYFQDFKSWWRWEGLNARQYAIYNNEIVWASAGDQNVYKYDETVFADQSSDENGDTVGNPIHTYRQTNDTENYHMVGRTVIYLRDRFKQARFAIIRGYISTAARDAKFSIIYDGNPDNAIVGTFQGDDDCIVFGNPVTGGPNNSNIYGRVIYGRTVYAGSSSLFPSNYPMREFRVVLSLDGYSYCRARLNFELFVQGSPYIIFYKNMWSELEPEEKMVDCQKI